jgi:hypothetical protein
MIVAARLILSCFCLIVNSEVGLLPHFREALARTSRPSLQPAKKASQDEQVHFSDHD